MPVIKTYNAQGNVVAKTPEPLRKEAAAELEPFRQVVETGQKVAQAWSDANDVMQYTKAKADYSMGVAQIDADAAADPDYNNAPKYQALREELAGNMLGGIQNKLVQQKTAYEFQVSNRISDIKTQSLYRAKQVEFNEINFATELDAIQKKLNAPGITEGEKNHYMQARNELIAVNIASGTITPKKADEYLDAAQKVNVQYDIYADDSMKESDSEVLKELRKGDKGKYAYLKEKDRLKLIKETQDRIFQNNQTFKRGIEISQDEKTQEYIRS